MLMEDSIRRRVFRLAFLLIVIAPGLGLLAFAGWRASPWSEDAARRSIREALGVEAAWERLAYSAPGVISFEQLQLLDAKSGALLAMIDRLTIDDSSGQRHVMSGVVRVSRGGIPKVSRVIELIDSEQLGDWQLGACEVQLIDAEGEALAITTISKAESWTADGVRRMLLRFRPGRDPQAEELKLDLELDPSADSMHLAFDTGKSPRALRAAGAIWPALGSLGDGATFAGTARFERTSAGWSGELQGVIDEIDLDRLVTQNTKQRLSGVGTLGIDVARFERGLLVEAKGSFGVGEGVMGMGLLSDLAVCFKPNRSSDLTEDDLRLRATEVPFSEIRVTYRIQPGGVQFAGASMPGDAWVRDAEGEALLFGPPKESRPPATMVKLLFPTSSQQIAAAGESLWLAQWLPLPRAAELAEYQPPEKIGNPVRTPGNR